MGHTRNTQNPIFFFQRKKCLKERHALHYYRIKCCTMNWLCRVLRSIMCFSPSGRWRRKQKKRLSPWRRWKRTTTNHLPRMEKLSHLRTPTKISSLSALFYFLFIYLFNLIYWEKKNLSEMDIISLVFFFFSGHVLVFLRTCSSRSILGIMCVCVCVYLYAIHLQKEEES